MKFRSSSEVNVLLDVLEKITGETSDVDSTLRHIAQTAQSLFNADSCVILTINPITNNFGSSPTIEGNILPEEIAFERPQTSELAQYVLQQGLVLIDNLETAAKLHTFFPHAEHVRSFAAATLWMRDGHKPLGILYMNFTQPVQFETADQELLRLFVRQASFILHRTWLLWRYQEVTRIGKEINHELATVSDLFETLPQQIAGILDANYTLLLAVYQQRNNALDLYITENGHYFLLKDDLLEGACQYVLQNGQSISIQHLTKEAPNLPFQAVPIEETDSVESLLFVPLLLRDVPLGVLSIQHTDAYVYDHEDLAILELLANHITLALYNIRLYDNLKLLNETGQVLTQQLDTEQTMQAAVEKILEAAEADLAILYPFDPTLQTFILPPRVVGSLQKAQPQLLFPDTQDGITGLALRSHETIFAVDATELYFALQGAIHAGNFGQSEKIRSTVVLPLRVGEESVGVLFLNFRQKQSFKSPQRLLIEGLGHYIAIAIKNALAFGSLAQRRYRELAILQYIDRQLGLTLELKSVLDTLLRLAQEHVPAEEASILLYNSRTQTLETKAAIGRHAEISLAQKIRLRDMKGITRWVLEYKQPVLVKNVRTEMPWRDLHLEVAADTIAELDVPLLDGDEVVGILNFESVKEGAFSKEDQDFLATLSGQAVLAIRNAQAFDREKRLVEEGRIIDEVSKEIISHLEPASIFHLILTKALEVTNTTRGILMIYDTERNDLWMAAERGVVGKEISAHQSMDEGIVGYVARHKHLLNVDLLQEPWHSIHLNLIPGMRSGLAVPMLAGEDLRGVLNIESMEENYFTERDEHMLVALAALAVIALQNAQAYEREKWYVKEAQALNEISKEISSQPDPNRIFNLILTNALNLTDSVLGSLHLYDPTTDKLQMIAYKGVAPAEKYQYQSLDEGIVGYAAKQKLLLSISDVSAPPWNEIYIESFSETRSELTVPMLEGELLRGVLNIESHLPHHYNDSHQRLLQGLADLAVVALQNAAERYEKAANEAKRFKLLYYAGKQLGELANVTELDQAYDVILHVAEEQSKGKVAIYGNDADTQDLALICSSRHYMFSPAPHMKLDEKLEDHLKSERYPIIFCDNNSSSFNIPIYLCDPTTRSLAIVPIAFKGRHYGILALSREEASQFQEIDTDFFQGLADQLASTIYRLQTAQERQELEQRAKSAEEMSSIGESAYEVTHRLGNDLGLVDFYLNKIHQDMKKKSISSHVIDDNLGKIRQSVQRVLSFSKDLKEELAKLSEEETLIEPLVVAPRVLLQRALEAASLPPYIQVEMKIDEDVKDVRIVFGRISDVLHNLVTNAFQALPSAGGIIILRAYNVGRAVALEVTDTGSGIPPEKLPKIFDLFFSTKGSSGFGLWSARRIALKNQGDLKAAGGAGQKTTFTLLLPGADE